MPKLTGKSFCFTGVMSRPRAELVALVHAHGGEVRGSVRRGLTYLVQADPTSRTVKTREARASGVAIIGESEFFTMTNARVSPKQRSPEKPKPNRYRTMDLE
jgi:DNA ligase (NAD+)